METDVPIPLFPEMFPHEATRRSFAPVPQASYPTFSYTTVRPFVRSTLAPEGRRIELGRIYPPKIPEGASADFRSTRRAKATANGPRLFFLLCFPTFSLLSLRSAVLCTIVVPFFARDFIRYEETC